MGEETLRLGLAASFKNRAMLYYLLFDELRKEIGENRAADVMRRAIERRGRQIGKKFAPYGPSDLKGLCGEFLKAIAEEGDPYAPVVEHCDDQALDICLRKCPLKEAWIEANIPRTDVAKLCEIASVVDSGLFEEAGFRFFADHWTPGGDGSCHLHVRPGASKP